MTPFLFVDASILQMQKAFNLYPKECRKCDLENTSKLATTLTQMRLPSPSHIHLKKVTEVGSNSMRDLKIGEGRLNKHKQGFEFGIERCVSLL